jgi:hypothetical protein
MAHKAVLTTALFEQLNSFTTELIEMYPDDPDFPLVASSVRMFKMMNPSFLVKNIYDNTMPFEKQIIEKDEAFFMQYSFSEFEKDVEDINVFSKLKKYNENMSDASKNGVWKYIQNIYKLAKAIIETA